MKKALLSSITLATLFCAGASQAAALSQAEQTDLVSLVASAGSTVYLAEYCNMPGAKQTAIKNKVKEIRAFGVQHVRADYLDGTYRTAQGEARARSATTPRDVECAPTATHYLAEQFSNLADTKMMGWKATLAK